MQADFPVLMDACVLANHAVADLLLRLADGPRLFCPRWTQRIVEETRRTLINDLGWPRHLVDSREQALRDHFPEAWISDFEHLESEVPINPKDCHIVAAAIWGDCQVIATYNLRDFPPEPLGRWSLEVQHPAELLGHLFDLHEAAVISRIDEIATDRSRSRKEVLRTLSRFVPTFAMNVAERLEIDLDG